MPLLAHKCQPHHEENTYVELTTISEKDVFEDLQESGFNGNDEFLLNDFRKLSPILNAIGLHPEKQNRWRVDNNRMKAVNKRRSKR